MEDGSYNPPTGSDASFGVSGSHEADAPSRMSSSGISLENCRVPTCKTTKVDLVRSDLKPQKSGFSSW